MIPNNKSIDESKLDSRSFFAVIVAFLVAKNALKLSRSIAVKLQMKDQDIVAASNMIDETISNIKDLRENIESEFCDWFTEVTRIVEAAAVWFPGFTIV